MEHGVITNAKDLDSVNTSIRKQELDFLAKQQSKSSHEFSLDDRITRTSI